MFEKVESSFKLFAQKISGTDPCLLTFSARKIDFAQCFVGSTFVAYQPLGEGMPDNQSPQSLQDVNSVGGFRHGFTFTRAGIWDRFPCWQ